MNGVYNDLSESQSKHLKILYYNARSLSPKIDELRANVLFHKPDLVCIVETWLSEDITDSEIFLFNYQIARLDRNRHGGGILIFIHCSLSYKLLLQGGPHNLEFLSISVTNVFLNHTSCICLFYRPPASPVSIFDNLITTIQLVHPVKFSTFILLGDFNVNFQNPLHPLFLYLNDILLIFSLKQVVSSFTHICPNANTSLIDLVMLSDPLLLKSCVTVPPLASSDHLGVSLVVEWKVICRSFKNPSRLVWIYKNGDFARACELIDDFDWECVFSDDVDSSASSWSPFLEIMNECVPQRALSLRKNLPWLTNDITRLIHQRNSQYQKAKKSNDPSQFALYKTLRNKVVEMLRSAKMNYFNSLSPSNSKHFWKSVKLLKKQPTQIPSLYYGKSEANTSNEKAEMLNSFFSKCWNYSVAPLHETSKVFDYLLAVEENRLIHWIWKCQDSLMSSMTYFNSTE